MDRVKLADHGQETISNIIRNRLIDKGMKFFCNDNISEVIKEGELELLQKEVEEKFEQVLKSLVIDTERDHNSLETAHRVAKMYVQEIFNGRYVKKPDTKSFPNVSSYNELYLSKGISVRSVCGHHYQPIRGVCHIGLFPSKNVIGLSKFNRLVDWVSQRPQIQEEMTTQIADLIEEETQAEGVAVVIRAEHGCITNRGVKEHESEMVTSVMRGLLRTNEILKHEFLTLMNMQK